LNFVRIVVGTIPAAIPETPFTRAAPAAAASNIILVAHTAYTALSVSLSRPVNTNMVSMKKQLTVHAGWAISRQAIGIGPIRQAVLGSLDHVATKLMNRFRDFAGAGPAYTANLHTHANNVED
jgi:hypothetical protein